MTHLPISQVSNEASPLFSQVLGKLDTLGKLKRGGQLIGVAGCRRGDGATYVTRGLARNMARMGRRALCADASHLVQALANPGEILTLCEFTDELGMWVLREPVRRHGVRRVHGTLRAQLDPLWRQVDCIVVDLGAATTSGEVSRFAPDLDDILLVVAAGETKRTQVTFACNVIADCGGKLTGCVLNKRTYPIPNALYRALR